MAIDEQPVFILIAGPNGSGKSTLQKALQARYPEVASLPFLNADNLAKASGIGDYVAGEQIRQQVERNIATKQSLVWESVMSHPSKIDYMRQANENGFTTLLYFVGTASPDINVANVKLRVANGGQDVPEDKIRSR